MTEPNHKAVAVIEKHDLPERMHPVVAKAMQQDLDPQTLRELLAVQREYEAGEARKAFSCALVNLKRDLPTVIAKDTTVDFKSLKGGRVYYKHTSLAAVMDAITEPLTQHGFSLAWAPRTEQNTVHVTCRLTHSAGHVEETTISAPIDISGSKSPAQGVASTITLLQRYTCLSLLGIATADMPEPQDEIPPDHVSSDANLRAVRAVVNAGRTKEQAEKMIGRPVQEWTAADLDKLRDWLPKPEPSKKLAEALDIIGRAQTAGELDAIRPRLTDLKLNKAEREKAGAAYEARLAEIKKTKAEEG